MHIYHVCGANIAKRVRPDQLARYERLSFRSGVLACAKTPAHAEFLVSQYRGRRTAEDVISVNGVPIVAICDSQINDTHEQVWIGEEVSSMVFGVMKDVARIQARLGVKSLSVTANEAAS